MANDDGRLLVACILGFGGGIYTFLKGFRQYRKYRLVADTPKIRIRGVPMGLVQIRGEACAEKTLLSPITHTPCYLSQVVIEEWHTDSEGGGSWKHLATDVQSVKFYLQDATGNMLIDPTNAELDLPGGPFWEVRSHASGVSIGSSIRVQGGSGAGAQATEAQLLQYIQEARLRHMTQMVGRGVSLLSRGVAPAHEPQRQSLLNMLADPSGAGAEGFRNQMMKAALGRHDPSGEIPRLALEVWKHPQGTPEFEAALARLAQAYTRAMGSRKTAFDPSEVMAQVHQNPQALAMVAAVAGATEPQADPETERARQAALAFGRDHAVGITQKEIGAASGHYRLKEYCLLPGKVYDITGTCVENPNPQDEHDRNVLVKGVNEPTFLISSRTDKEVQSWLWKQSLWMIFGGAALAVVCLAVILGKLGLL